METYEAIYERMKERYEQECGAEFDSASDIAIRLRVLAGEIYNMQTSVEWLRRQLFPSTAAGTFLDRFAEQRGLARREAVKAHGNLRFSIGQARATPVTIPRGTTVNTNDENPVVVCTTEDAVIEAGRTWTVAPAEAEEAGYCGNIRSHSARVPVNVPAAVTSVTNTIAFHGGADSESDTSLRARILDSYVNRPNGMNAAYYIALAMSVDGIAKAGVVPRRRGAGTVDVFVAGHSGTVSSEKLAEVQALMNAERELNVDVQVGHAYSLAYDMHVAVTPKEGYTAEEVVALCTAAFEEYLAGIPMGSMLYLSMLGKYLLDTGCIVNYQMDAAMVDMPVPASKYFTPGTVNIEVNG